MASPRNLIVGHEQFLWTRGHGHESMPDGSRRCFERVSVWRPTRDGGRLLIRFVDGKRGATTAGEGWGGHDGGLLVGGHVYNLNRPGVVAALVRQALAEGWDPRARGDREIEGFGLLARANTPQGIHG